MTRQEVLMVKKNFEKHCGEFSRMVREVFDYLFDEYGFAPVFQDEGSRGDTVSFLEIEPPNQLIWYRILVQFWCN